MYRFDITAIMDKRATDYLDRIILTGDGCPTFPWQYVITYNGRSGHVTEYGNTLPIVPHGIDTKQYIDDIDAQIQININDTLIEAKEYTDEQIANLDITYSEGVQYNLNTSNGSGGFEQSGLYLKNQSGIPLLTKDLSNPWQDYISFQSSGIDMGAGNYGIVLDRGISRAIFGNVMGNMATVEATEGKIKVGTNNIKQVFDNGSSVAPLRPSLYQLTLAPDTPNEKVVLEVDSDVKALMAKNISIADIDGAGNRAIVTKEWVNSKLANLRLPIPHGTTAQRTPYEQIGQQYLDTTLGYQIIYNGTNWVNATGATV